MHCAVIDVGSNTIHMVLYQVQGQKAQKIFSQKEAVGLFSYVSNGALSDKGLRKAGEVLSDFAGTLRGLGVSPVHCFATAALRGLKNEAEVLARLRRDSGVDVVVIDGQEEAELGLYSLRNAAWFDAEAGLLFDLGGGSLELTRYARGATNGQVSLPLGSLLLYERFVTGLFPTARESEAIARHVRDILVRLPFLGAGIPCVYGIGGTVRALAKLDKELVGKKAPTDGYPLAAGRLWALCDLFFDSGLEQQTLLVKQCPERLLTMIPGLLAIGEIMKAAPADSLRVSAKGVREGYLEKYVLSGAASQTKQE